MPPDSDIRRLKDRACANVDAHADELIALSHAIHARPELNFEEHFACESLVRLATECGLDAHGSVYGVDTALAADAGTGPRVAFVSEYDALPGIGHGCGHNVIAAAGIGAAIAGAEVCGEAGGSVRLLGTPAEEGGGGKIAMARNGAFEGVDLAMMVHPADADLTEIDAIAVQQLFVQFEGVAAHAAAAPHEGRNALDAAVLGYMSIAALRQHIRPSERVHGIFTHGGDKPNIVPRHAEMEWYVRSDTIASLQPLKKRVLACLQSGADGCGCTMSHSWDDHTYAEMLTNSHVVASYVANAGDLGRRVADPALVGHRVVGSTDMGNISQLVPSIHPMIAITDRGTPIHTEAFAAAARRASADRAVLDGAKAMVMTAIDFWTSASMRDRVRSDFEERRSRTAVL